MDGLSHTLSDLSKSDRSFGRGRSARDFARHSGPIVPNLSGHQKTFGYRRRNGRASLLLNVSWRKAVEAVGDRGTRVLDHGFLLFGRTPSVDGRPSVSRRWATEPLPRSGKLRSVSSDVSRTSPIHFIPAAFSAFRIRLTNRTLSMGV